MALREYKLTDHVDVETSSRETLCRDTRPETAARGGQSMALAYQASLT